MSFSAIDLSRLAAPVIISQPDFETIFAARKARLLELDPDLADVLELESEPLVMLLQEDSYREMLLRAAVQDAGKGNLLAFAEGAVLDHLAALYGVERRVVVEAQPEAVPPVAAVLEADDRLRARVQLAPEGFTTAGSIGAYTFWALSASTEVKDIALQMDAPAGQVDVVVLSTAGNGEPDQALLDAVEDVLSADTVRPLCDHVVVSGAQITEFTIVAELTFFPGPDSALVLAAAQAAVETFADARHRLGHDITHSGIYAALHQEGVQNVVLTSPAADMVVASTHAAFCTSIALTDGGRDV